MSKYYPDCYIPDALQKIATAQPPIPNSPSEPSRPISPEKPNWVTPITVGIISLIVSFVFLNKIPVVAPIIALFFTFGTRFLTFQNYKKELSIFRDREREYPKQVGNYQYLRDKYNQDVEKLRSPEQIKKHREVLLSKFCETIHQPNTDGDARQGKYDQRLWREMQKHLEGNSILKTYLNIPDYDYPYSPDICYIIDGIYFDIEIDEPYYKDGQGNVFPCHGYDDYKDDSRNEFFLERNWIVIRFAEEQVARNIKGCCKEIAKKVNELTGRPIPSSLNNVDDLIIIPRWTRWEGTDMGSNHYRDTY